MSLVLLTLKTTYVYTFKVKLKVSVSDLTDPFLIGPVFCIFMICCVGSVTQPHASVGSSKLFILHLCIMSGQTALISQSFILTIIAV